MFASCDGLVSSQISHALQSHKNVAFGALSSARPSQLIPAVHAEESGRKNAFCCSVGCPECQVSRTRRCPDSGRSRDTRPALQPPQGLRIRFTTVLIHRNHMQAVRAPSARALLSAELVGSQGALVAAALLGSPCQARDSGLRCSDQR